MNRGAALPEAGHRHSGVSGRHAVGSGTRTLGPGRVVSPSTSVRYPGRVDVMRYLDPIDRRFYFGTPLPEPGMTRAGTHACPACGAETTGLRELPPSKRRKTVRPADPRCRRCRRAGFVAPTIEDALL